MKTNAHDWAEDVALGWEQVRAETNDTISLTEHIEASAERLFDRIRELEGKSAKGETNHQLTAALAQRERDLRALIDRIEMRELAEDLGVVREARELVGCPSTPMETATHPTSSPAGAWRWRRCATT